MKNHNLDSMRYTLPGKAYQFGPYGTANQEALEYYTKVPSNKENNNTMKKLTLYKVTAKVRYGEGPTWEVSKNFSNKQKADGFEAEQWKKIMELGLLVTGCTVEMEKFYLEYEDG